MNQIIQSIKVNLFDLEIFSSFVRNVQTLSKPMLTFYDSENKDFKGLRGLDPPLYIFLCRWEVVHNDFN